MSIEVHVRLRPQDPSTVAWSTAETVLYNVAQPETRYVFHKVHPLQNTTNHSIFRGVEPIVLTAFENHQHVSLLAYGPTGSGKTHSMSGTSDDHGIIQRTTRLLVKLASTHPGTTLGVSFLEVYNECVRDLLDPTRGNGDLALQDAPDGAVRVDKKVVPVESVGQFTALEKMAEQHRCYGVTDLNAHSSRSHVIITFEVRRRRRSPVDESGKAAEHDEKEEEEGAGGGSSRESRNAYTTHLVHLVDLAGAECAGKARTEGQSLREGGFINKSLLALGNVVDALVERRPHIPYRDAKLTRLLRSALGGTGYTFILCCMHPGKESVEQTASALRFAQRAMRLKRDPVVVLPIPPLFTHQYAIAATSLLQSASYCADLAYQRGLKDAFFYCDPTVSSLAQQLQSEVGDSLRALAGMQRLLLAHEHTTALEVVGEWYHKRDAAKEVYNEALVKRRAAQDQLESVQEESRVRVKEVHAEEQALTALRNETDATLAEWEYKLKEVQRQRVTPLQLLLKKEEEDRRRLEYEWCVCVERIVYDCLHHDQLLHALVEGGDVKGKHHTPEASTEENGHSNNNNSSSSQATSPFPPVPLLPLPGDWRENGQWKAQWAEKIQHERRAVLELEAARGLLQERGSVSSAYGRHRTSGGGGTAWRGNEKEEEEDDDDALRKEGDANDERGTPSPSSSSSQGVQGLLALDAQLDALGMEEQRLRRMLLFNTHRYSLRRIRSSTSETSLSSLSNSPSQHRTAAPPPTWRKKRDEHEDGSTTAGSREGWRTREGIRRHHFEQDDEEEDEEEAEAEKTQRHLRREAVQNDRSQREGGEEGGGRLRQTAPAVPIPSGAKATTPPHPSTPPPLPSSSSSPATSPTEVLRAAPRASPAATRRISSPTPLPLSHPLRAKERGAGGATTTSSTAMGGGTPLSPLLSTSLSRPPLAGGYAGASASTNTAGWMRRAGESPSPCRSASTTHHSIHVYPPHAHRSRSRSETGEGGGGRSGASHSREPVRIGAKSTLQLIQELKQSIQSPSSTTTMGSSSEYLSDHRGGGGLRTPAHVYRRSASSSSHRSHSRPLAPTTDPSGAHLPSSHRTDTYRHERRGEGRSMRAEEKWGTGEEEHHPRRGRSPFQGTSREGSASPYSDTLSMPLGRPGGTGGGHTASSSTFSYPTRLPSKTTIVSTSSSLATPPSASSYDTVILSHRSVKRAGDENGGGSPLHLHHHNSISGLRSSSSSNSGGGSSGSGSGGEKKRHPHSPLSSGYNSSEREQKMWKRTE